MGFPPRAAAIAIQTEGDVSATVSISEEDHAAEVTVWGKLVFALGHEGELSLVRDPEVPGYNRGAPDPGELDASARRIIVRGTRSLPGRIVLRRGPNALAELEFAAGSEPAVTGLANTMQTTLAGSRGDEWLVVEGVDAPQARRWCKLPKLGVMATWADPSAIHGPASVPALERMLLTSRLCFVDVSTWMVSFVMRGARKVLRRNVPTSVTVAIHDLGAESLPGGFLGRRAPPPPVSPIPSSPRPGAFHFDSGPTVMSRRDEPAPKPIIDDETTGIHLTTQDVVDDDGTARTLDAASGRSVAELARALTAARGEPTLSKVGPPPRVTAPTPGGHAGGPPPSEGRHDILDESSVSRAFAALTAPPEAAPEPKSPREEKTLLSAFNPKESPVVKKR